MIEALSITKRRGFLFLRRMMFELKKGTKMKIHLIEKLNNFKKLRDNIWESGGWKLNESKAKGLIGGKIYFHKERQEASFYGGTVRGFRVEQDGQNQGKIAFEFQYHQECRNIRTDRTGWSMKMKIIAEPEAAIASRTDIPAS
jgi:hypothetical protein